MTEFINFWKNYVNFSDRTTVRGYWMAVLFLVIINVVISIIAAVTDLFFLSVIWLLAIIVPSLAMSIRRLRDAGKPWTWIFINFVPCVGFIMYIVIQCKPSVPDDGTPVV